MDIAIVCFDGFTDIDTFLPWDLLNRVRLREDGWSVKLLGDKPEHITIAGLKTPMHGTLDDAKDADAVLFTSGAKGIRTLLEDGAWLDQFRLDPARQMIGSMCTGSVLLAKLELLEGLTATTYPTSVALLESLGIRVVEEPIVIHGNIATAAGCLAAERLSRWVIEGLTGKGDSGRRVGGAVCHSESEACAAALVAAQDAKHRVETLNADLTTSGQQPIQFGIGVHLGNVMYGNIGVPERLEFTVIGSAANEAARIESLCKTLDQSILLSEEVARHYSGELQSLGYHTLRGVSAEQEIFTLPE